MNPPKQLQSLDFDIADLMLRCPPVWKHAHKRAVYERAREGGPVNGTLGYTRWAPAESLGEEGWHPCELLVQPGYYKYPVSNRQTWHVNFADPRLFVAYGSALLAQDELQALEHPVLGSLREALLDAGHPALTREDGRSTPVLVMDAPRQCAFDVIGEASRKSWWQKLTAGAASARSLYGNAFQHADLEEVLHRVAVLSPPTLTNFIAMVAPVGGTGRYTRKQIMDVLETACCGFKAAVMVSGGGGVADEPISINTGWWGCGAFGGNKVVMAMLQMLAARIAGVDRLIFHIGLEAERNHFENARATLEEVATTGRGDVTEIVGEIERRGFTWGVSDGN